MRGTILLAALLLVSGCVTGRVRLGARRSELYAARQGASGDALGAAVAREMGEVNRELGADRIPAESVALTPEAAAANAEAVAGERSAREALVGAARGALDWAGSHWPPLGAALGLAGAVAALWRKLAARGEALGSAQKALGAAITLTQAVKERLKAGALSFEDFQAIYQQAQAGGESFVEGSRELYAEYQRAKQEWRSGP